MAEVYVEKVCKQFNRVCALDHVSCVFEDGQLTVLVGPSGCGKTTLLRMIAGLELASDGAIYIGSDNVAGVPPWERNVAMVFQSYALYPHMTVFRNLAFPLEATKTHKDEIRGRVQKAAERLQIEDLLDRKPRQLSGGQMQRVALGRAIIREPDVFLMDEPLSNLDAKLRVLMRAELKHLQQQLGVTTIYVTHDQAEAMTLADKLVVMYRGCIQQIGKPEDIYRYPCNQFVAGFIGSPPMNFIDCRYEPGAGVLAGDGLAYGVNDVVRRLLEPRGSGKLVLGVRPEDLTVRSTANGGGGVAATIYVMEQLGRELLVNALVGETLVRAYAPPMADLKAGQQIWLDFAPEAVHVFDGESEETLVSANRAFERPL